MINFYLPDFYYRYKLNIEIVNLLEQHPEYFYDNIKIGAIYGSFPGAIWNGGRLMLNTTDLNNINDTIKTFNSKNIPIHFTFTNCLLTEEHLNDTYCNLIAEMGHNNMNGIIINSPILEKYLREKYPQYQYISSTTKCERNINNINIACNQYDLVVTDYRDNSNINLLKQIQQKDKIKLLINSYCDPNCNKRSAHYTLLSLGQLQHQKQDLIEQCPTFNRTFIDSLNFNSVIKVDDLYSTYNNMGFNHFKIEGRLINIYDLIESYVYYLIKPEYKNKIRLLLLRLCG